MLETNAYCINIRLSISEETRGKLCDLSTGYVFMPLQIVIFHVDAIFRLRFAELETFLHPRNSANSFITFRNLVSQLLGAVKMIALGMDGALHLAVTPSLISVSAS